MLWFLIISYDKLIFDWPSNRPSRHLTFCGWCVCQSVKRIQRAVTTLYVTDASVVSIAPISQKNPVRPESVLSGGWVRTRSVKSNSHSSCFVWFGQSVQVRLIGSSHSLVNLWSWSVVWSLPKSGSLLFLFLVNFKPPNSFILVPHTHYLIVIKPLMRRMKRKVRERIFLLSTNFLLFTKIKTFCLCQFATILYFFLFCFVSTSAKCV